MSRHDGLYSNAERDEIGRQLCRVAPNAARRWRQELLYVECDSQGGSSVELPVVLCRTTVVPMIPRRTVLSVQPVAERGGSDQALLRLARQLGKAGWAVHVALPASSPMAAEFTSVGVTLHVLPMRRISTSHGLGTWLAYLLAWPVSVVRLWRLARDLRVDVVHSNSLHSWYGWAAAWLARKPHIWHAREIVVQSNCGLAPRTFPGQHFAQRVLAVSAAVASQLDPRNVVVVHEEADPAEFFPGRAGRAREAFGLPDDALVVGYVGRIDTWKGVDVLLEALPQLQREQELAAGRQAFGARTRGGSRRGYRRGQGGVRRVVSQPERVSSGCTG